MGGVNIWAVLVAALMTFMLGGFWYSKALFGAVWHRESGTIMSPKDASEPKHPAGVFAISFVLSVVAAYVLAIYLGPAPALDVAVKAGAAAGIGFVAASFGINYAFASRTLKLWLIDAGYHAVQFTLFGLVLGLWH